MRKNKILILILVSAVIMCTACTGNIAEGTFRHKDVSDQESSKSSEKVDNTTETDVTTDTDDTSAITTEKTTTTTVATEVQDKTQSISTKTTVATKKTTQRTSTTQSAKKTTKATKKTTQTTKKTEPVATGVFFTEYEDKVLELVNIEREKAGVSKLLGGSNNLLQATRMRAQEQVVYFSHTRPGENPKKPEVGGKEWHTVLDDFDISYSLAGENLAKGHKNPQQVVTGWMESNGHRKNMLNEKYTHLRVACYLNEGVYYWGQLLITK